MEDYDHLSGLTQGFKYFFRDLMRWLLLFSTVSGLSVPPVTERLKGVQVSQLSDGTSVDVGEMLASSTDASVTVFGTYAADFNAIEYCQRIRHYASQLPEITLILNASPESAKELCSLVDLPETVRVLCDPGGSAGRAFGVLRGWKPDDDELVIFGQRIPLNAYGKLFGMLWGLGALGTLPAVIGGYLGNPIRPQPWIDDAMKQNNDQKRWPRATSEQFAELPIIGEWERRPLELATLRLQNMLGISLKHWDSLKPSEDQVLTQLGGLLLTQAGGESIYEWKDPGICAVCNFEDVVKKL